MKGNPFVWLVLYALSFAFIVLTAPFAGWYAHLVWDLLLVGWDR